MSWLSAFWRSSIGGKVTMAVTGVLLFGFVVAHLLGNLLIFGEKYPATAGLHEAGRYPINLYAEKLHDLGALLWVARIGLLVIFVLHVVTAIRLSRANKAARPVAYAKSATMQASMASRSMVFSGLSLLAFVVYHLMHFTLGVVHVDDFAKKGANFDVYSMVIASFSKAPIAGAYIAFQVLLFLHLQHGLQSFAQTVGLHHGRYTPWIKSLAFLLALAVAVGNISIVVFAMQKGAGS